MSRTFFDFLKTACRKNDVDLIRDFFTHVDPEIIDEKFEYLAAIAWEYGHLELYNLIVLKLLPKHCNWRYGLMNILTFPSCPKFTRYLVELVNPNFHLLGFHDFITEFTVCPRISKNGDYIQHYDVIDLDEWTKTFQFLINIYKTQKQEHLIAVFERMRSHGFYYALSRRNYKQCRFWWDLGHPCTFTELIQFNPKFAATQFNSVTDAFGMFVSINHPNDFYEHMIEFLNHCPQAISVYMPHSVFIKLLVNKRQRKIEIIKSELDNVMRTVHCLYDFHVLDIICEYLPLEE